MRIYFDSEFTGLHKKSELISIGLISDCGKEFYAEFSDFSLENCKNDRKWLEENVIKKLKFYKKKYDAPNKRWITNKGKKDQKIDLYGDKIFIQECLGKWLNDFVKVEMWSDCLAYDWVLFCDLWEHAFFVPSFIYYIPFDICTLFKDRGIDPDINREEFSKMTGGVDNKHNALWDAKVIKACYEKIYEEK